MTIFTAGGAGSRNEDWVFVGVVLASTYLLIYPAYVLYKRQLHSRRIKNQLVTSEYKLPTKMTPTELSYLFTSKMNKNHLYATLLDLANRSVVVIRQKEGKAFVEPGPKIDSNLTESETFLTNYIFEANRPVPVNQVVSGYTHTEIDNQNISGSKHYVYWWILRKQLRKRKIIEDKMTGRYSKMLFSFGVITSLVISIVSISVWRFLLMLDSGEVDVSRLTDHWKNAFIIWVLMLIPIILVSFIDLRFRGRMLGRLWLLTKSNRRYINQIIAFKEYVRLTSKEKLRFESEELKKESTNRTKPYAIALGFIKDDRLTGK